MNARLRKAHRDYHAARQIAKGLAKAIATPAAGVTTLALAEAEAAAEDAQVRLIRAANEYERVRAEIAAGREPEPLTPAEAAEEAGYDERIMRAQEHGRRHTPQFDGFHAR